MTQGGVHGVCTSVRMVPPVLPPTLHFVSSSAQPRAALVLGWASVAPAMQDGLISAGEGGVQSHLRRSTLSRPLRSRGQPWSWGGRRSRLPCRMDSSARARGAGILTSSATTIELALPLSFSQALALERGDGRQWGECRWWIYLMVAQRLHVQHVLIQLVLSICNPKARITNSDTNRNIAIPVVPM